MTVAAGSDHAGFALKQALVSLLRERGHEVRDLGTREPVSCDYPDPARDVARSVAGGEADLGLLVCGTGIGMAIAANKVAGVRAAVCRSGYEARMARRHNDANVLCLGERVTGPGLAEEILETFLAERFEGGRHARRVNKVRALERVEA